MLSAGKDGIVEQWDLTSAAASAEGSHTAAVRKVAARGDQPRFSLSDHELLGWSDDDPTIIEAVNQKLNILTDEKRQIAKSGSRIQPGWAISDIAYNDSPELLLRVGVDGSWAITSPQAQGQSLNWRSGRWKVPLVACGFVGGSKAVMVDQTGAILVLDLREEKLRVLQSELDNVSAAAFASHAPLVLLGTGKGRVRMLHLDTEAVTWGMDHDIDQQARFTYANWNGSGEALHFAGISAGGERALLSFVDDEPLIIDVPSGSATTLRGHDALVFAGALSENGETALSGDLHGRVIAWDAKSGAPLTTVTLDAPVTAATIANGSYYIGDERGRIFQARLLPATT